MSYNPFRRLFCCFGIHKRSRGSIREIQGMVLSNCRYCHVPMCKIDGTWVVRR